MRTYLSSAAIVLAITIFVNPLPALSQASGNGKPAPDMKGPAPRRANGKPSMAGIWSTTRRADVTNKNIPGYVELSYTEWGKKEWETYDPNRNGDYAGTCLPFGFSRSLYGPHPTQIVQDNDYVVFLFEQNTMFHIVPIDGRGFTQGLPSSWFGESIGRWDGDTLIIETRNINGWARIDTIGHPISNQAKITQTYKRLNFGSIEHTFTVDDPKTYTKPWTIRETWPMEPWGTTLMEYACMEGNVEGLLSGAIKAWRPPKEEQ
jgi:hypothetical protein